MSYLHLQTFQFFSKSGSLSVIELNPVTVQMSDVKQFCCEVNHGLSFVNCSGRDINIESHLPMRGSDRVVETKPDLPSSSQWVIVGGEKKDLPTGVYSI